MAAHVQHDRHPVADPVQLGPGDHPALGDLLVEEQVAVADQPPVAGDVGQPRVQRIEDVGDGGAPGEPAVHAATAAEADVLQVHVRVDEPGQHDAVTDVVHREPGRAGLLSELTTADGVDAPTADDHRLGVGRPRDRDDPAHEGEVGGRLRRGGQGNRCHGGQPPAGTAAISSDGK